MVNLRKELSGVILPHDHFGTYLDNNNKTIDEELELQNVEYTGEILAELWSKLVIDGYPAAKNLSEKNYRILQKLSRKNVKLIMSVNLNTCCKLSNVLTKLVALHYNPHIQKQFFVTSSSGSPFFS